MKHIKISLALGLLYITACFLAAPLINIENNNIKDNPYNVIKIEKASDNAIQTLTVNYYPPPIS